MERLNLVLTHAAALLFGALMFRAAAVRILRTELRRVGPSATPYFQKGLRDRLYEAPMVLLIVPALEEVFCRFPLLLAFDRVTHEYAFAGILASASAFAVSRFVFSHPGIEFSGPAENEAESKRRELASRRMFVARIQAFIVGLAAGLALGALALQTQSLLAVFVVHIVGKFAIHRIVGILRAY